MITQYKSLKAGKRQNRTKTPTDSAVVTQYSKVFIQRGQELQLQVQTDFFSRIKTKKKNVSTWLKGWKRMENYKPLEKHFVGVMTQH